ncbi:hypothetical protein BpHYR1_032712, partial [Brachionus plicatilis]
PEFCDISIFTSHDQFSLKLLIFLADSFLNKINVIVNQVQNNRAQSFCIVLKVIKLTIEKTINSANNLKVLKLLENDQDLSSKFSKKLINYMMIEGQWGET